MSENGNGQQFLDLEEVVEDAFHGTSIELGALIEKERKFRLPQKANPDLKMGRGVYFWEDSIETAQEWAQAKFNQACVLQAIIRTGKHYDPENTEHKIAFNSIAILLMKERNLTEISPAQVFNYMAELGIIESARGRHNWGFQPFWKQMSEAVICVYNPERIDAPCVVWAGS